jgi:hypothetical protein
MHPQSLCTSMLSICKLFEKSLKYNFFIKFFFFHFQLRTAARVTATKVQLRRPLEICDSSRQLPGIEEFSRGREEITLQSLTNWNRLVPFFQAKNQTMFLWNVRFNNIDSTILDLAFSSDGLLIY